MLVSIKERYRLNQSGSLKETYHIVLDLSHSPLDYEVGDCIGVHPYNHPSNVSKILQALKATGEEKVFDREQNEHVFRHFLLHKTNLYRVSRKLLEFIKEKTQDTECYSFFTALLSPSSKESLKDYLEHTHLVDLISSHGTLFSPQELCHYLAPLMPRFYSIASSRHCVGSEVHLTVAVTRYQIQEIEKTGVCSNFLCYLAPLHQPVIPIFLQKARDFVLNEDALHQPLIMIGPGTGVAPFRGFMQERILKSACHRNWLFFGERNRAYDFYYEDFWTSLVSRNELRIDAAFSRDQTEKVYVQHKMLENARELWQWIYDGAYIFVCGDASRMAKDVDVTLHQIVKDQGHFSEEDARLFIKSLRHQGRYLRDVY